ncbi:DUF2911 domain-containing protein [Leptobacterium flavescens]|uniref:DUF2911 domain-containing protein n=1 Tax=Leptobacterium flavescens TaxID=472055 RepID=A0A6P0UNB0_9FLAO|nr:DUF2911 domain-containing protein [Leptobacterium flavescens]NER13358.1 DUF2911 domain-containing protein [Leptobacterium flavescens]
MRFSTTRAIFSIFAGVAFLFTTEANAQLTLPATSQEAEVSQRVGITDITIHYNRPAVRGRQVWGALVPYGFNNLGFGTATAAPWRAGADYNTTIEFTHDVKLEGKDVKAGKYALFMAPKENGDVTIVLSNNTTSWGSFFYDQAEDALRVDVKSKDADHRELLTYEFNTVNPTATVASLFWEKKEIPFKIDVAVSDIVMKGIENDLRNPKGFNQNTWDQAARYAMGAGNMDKALEWVNSSISGNFFSKETYTNLTLRAQILMQQGKKAEALADIDKAIPLATNAQMFNLSNQLITAGEKGKALTVAKNNVKKNKGAWPSNYVLARAYSANGDFKNAIKNLNKSLESAPDRFKGRLNGDLAKLQKGEDITQ